MYLLKLIAINILLKQLMILAVSNAKASIQESRALTLNVDNLYIHTTVTEHCKWNAITLPLIIAIKIKLK